MDRKVGPYDKYERWTTSRPFNYLLESSTSNSVSTSTSRPFNLESSTSNSVSTSTSHQSQENVRSRSSSNRNQPINFDLVHFQQFQPRATSTPFIPTPPRPSTIAAGDRAPFIEHFEAYWKTMNTPYQREAVREEIEMLRRKGALNCRSVHQLRGSTLTKDVVLTLMDFAYKLQVNDEVKYKALELYDSLAIHKNEEMHKILKSKTLPSTTSKERAREEHKLIKKQRSKGKVFLDMVVCIQLCSRLHNNIPAGGTEGSWTSRRSNLKNSAHNENEILNNNEILEVIKHYNPFYELRDIHKKSIRISMMVNWKLNLITPMDFIASLICVLDIDKRIIRKIYSTSILVSDFVYLEHEHIYERFYELMIKKPLYYHLRRDDFRKIEYNLVLRGSAILMTAFYIILPQSNEKYTAPIVNLLQVPNDDLLDLSAIIIRHLLH